MNAPDWTDGLPKRVLLATDLSPRCDRALDRAASLAEQWQATLVIAHVLEEFEPDMPDSSGYLPSWRRPPDPLVVARKQLVADIGAVAEKATILIDQGDPAEVVSRIAERENCDLIVTGIARNELLGRVGLGRTVDRLLRRSRVPLLVVKNRARRPYRHIVVAIDFSESARHALEAAAQIFPRQKLTVFHAYDTPLSGRIMDSPSYQRQYRNVVERDCDTFLQGIKKPAGSWQLPYVMLEHGTPSQLLREYVREKEVDLVVLGTHGRSAVSEMFLGSVAKHLADEVPCDVMVIREPRAAAET